MTKYKAFISYRKVHATSADLVKKSLVEEYGFSSNDIFLDKQDIGPEYFDTKLKESVKSSSCLILIVTKDCFIPKKDGDDWFLEEIQLALDNNIPIIPLLFDGIKSLNEPEIIDQLKESFIDEEINKLIKTQSVPYDFDLSDATFSKLSKFIHTADKPDYKNKIFRIFKGLTVSILIFALVFCLFIGVGFLWGYFTSGLDSKDILVDNTYIEGNSAIFEFGGLEAKYDLDTDSVYIDLQNFKGEIPNSNLEMFAHSFSVSGAVVLFNKNVSAIKWLKYLKGGSKYNKIIVAGVTIGACIGSFCGFSQGSKWGRTLKQEREAMKLFPKLKNKDFWEPVFAENTLLKFKFTQLKNQRLFGNLTNVLNDINTLTRCYPDEQITIARDSGLTSMCIICKFNSWEIGKGTPNELSEEVGLSRQLKKM